MTGIALPTGATRNRRINRRTLRARRLAASPERLALVLDPLRLTLVIVTILTISRVHQHYGIFARLRPVLLFVMAAACYAYLNPRYLTRANVFALWPMRLIVLLAAIACGSVVFGISLGATAKFILDSYAKTLLYVILIALSIRTARDLYTFVWAFVVSTSLLVFFSLFVFGITRSSGSYVSRLDHMYTYDANDLGVIMMIGFALTCLLLVVARGLQRWFLILTLLGIAATIARSGSRGGFIGLIVTLLMALWLVKQVSVTKRLGLLVAGYIALTLGAPPGYWEQMGTLLRPKEDYNYHTRDGRKAVAERGIGYMRMYPWFGLGINQFSRAECTISPKLKTLDRQGPIRCTAPHNSYVQAGAELGVGGLITWSSLLFGGIIALLRMRKRLPREWVKGSEEKRFLYGATLFFPLALIGFAVTAFFVSFAWMDPIYLMSAFICGWYVVVRTRIPTLPVGEGLRVARALRLYRGIPGWRVLVSSARQRVAHSKNGVS